uniref:CG30101-PA-like protein n=1 Tax=Apis mellifera TaxID=7460 RepID=D3XL65_APIME|nr:CG30101-PA-like protein [Apis mellifera]
MDIKLAIVLVALATQVSCTEKSKAAEESVSPKDSVSESTERKTEKRGLHGSFGDLGGGGGDGDLGGGGGYDHHEEVKAVTVVKKVPVPYEVTKHVPYLVEKHVPYEVKVGVPQPLHRGKARSVSRKGVREGACTRAPALHR